MNNDSNNLNQAKLNLSAKEYKPKFAAAQSQPQEMYGNPYMMGNYGYGNYGYVNNMQFAQGGMNMGYPHQPGMYSNQQQGQLPIQIPIHQNQYNQMQPLQVSQQMQSQQVEEPSSSGIVGLKNKKKKGKAPQTQEPQNLISNTQQQPMMGQQPMAQYNPQQQFNNAQNPLNQPLQQQKLKPANQNPQANKPKDKKTQNQTTNKASSQKPAVQKKTDSQPSVNSVKKELSMWEWNEGELAKDNFEGQMIKVDMDRNPVSIVFVGHVDAGKSTISGSLLYNWGQIDERTIEKYQREAKVNNRESWFMAYIMDVNEEEREKGKTVEIGKAFFETKSKRFTLLDAPGHAGYIPNLLQGACQADFAGLVIAAKKGEFESGFDKSGSTREHALLLKALGVEQLIVIVNKMDEETVKWSEDRYKFIKETLKPFLKSCGYNVETNVYWIPVSGLTGDNLIAKVDEHKIPWYKGPTLTELLDSIPPPKRDCNGPVRLPILDRYRENNWYIMGKLENGTMKYGDTYTLMPSGAKVEVGWLFDTEERGVPYALPGESIRIRCKGLENESEVLRGNILCSNDNLCQIFNTFEAEIQVLQLQEHQIIANGFHCVWHFHTFIEECSIDIKTEIDKKTKEEKKVKFVRSQARIKAYVKTTNVLCGEKYENYPSLGRFSMRYEGMTIAIGKILKIKPYVK